MTCNVCKRHNHKTFDCFFRRKNRIKHKNPSFQNKAPKIDKITEPTKIQPDLKSVPVNSNLGQKPKPTEINSGLKPVQNSKLGIKPLKGGNLGSNPKFGNLISKPDSKSGLKQGNKTLEKECLESPSSRILKLEGKVKKLKREIKNLRVENLALNILYFTSSNSHYFDKIAPVENHKKQSSLIDV